jgi:hypothetical protein
MWHSVGPNCFHKVTPCYSFYFVGILKGKPPMNDFLKDCPIKSYGMTPNFGRLIQRYAILIPRYTA